MGIIRIARPIAVVKVAIAIVRVVTATIVPRMVTIVAVIAHRAVKVVMAVVRVVMAITVLRMVTVRTMGITNNVLTAVPLAPLITRRDRHVLTNVMTWDQVKAK